MSLMSPTNPTNPISLSRLLDVATRARVPVLIWGAPGVGKSAAIQAWAKSRHLPCWTVIASLREPADFGGLPIIGKESDGSPSVTFAPPRFAVEAAKEGGVIFLDELTTAPPAVQAALLRAVVDKAFGDLQLDPDKVTLVAAANPPGEAAGGWDLAAPLANRFTHHTYTLSATDWTDSFPAYWDAPPPLSFAGRGVSPASWTQARALVSGFIRARPALLLALPPSETQRGQAWPSPRTWDFASRIIAAVADESEPSGQGFGGASFPVDDLLPLLSGCVGEGPAVELCQFVREMDLPHPEDLLRKPGSYVHPKRGDQAYAILSAVSQAAIGNLTEKRWLAAWKILSLAAVAGGADVAAGAARSLARARAHRDNRHDRDDLPLPLTEIAAFFPILQAAGMIGHGA